MLKFMDHWGLFDTPEGEGWNDNTHPLLTTENSQFSNDAKRNYSTSIVRLYLYHAL